MKCAWCGAQMPDPHPSREQPEGELLCSEDCVVAFIKNGGKPPPESERVQSKDGPVRCGKCKHPLVWITTDLPNGGAMGRFADCAFCSGKVPS